MSDTDTARAVDWLGLCRRAATEAAATLAKYSPGERAATVGRGEGGDMTLEIDAAAEDAVFSQLDELGVPLTAISEERGHVDIAGGGPVHVVIDPIDGSRNAKRGIPAFALSIAVASGPTMGDTTFGYVHDFSTGEDWWANEGEGAFLDGVRLEPLPTDGKLEMVGLETVHPKLIQQWSQALVDTGVDRLRALGSIALSLCYVAAGRFDGTVSLGMSRSVDSAAGQLIVREAGGAVAFPDAADDPLAASLDLAMRSRVVAASSEELLARLLPIGA
jgi:myo-inositol-1(or 4)-monophosphatase